MFDQTSNGVRVTADAEVFPEGSVFKVSAVQDGEQGYKIINENVDSAEKIEHFTTYNVAVYDPDNNSIIRWI